VTRSLVILLALGAILLTGPAALSRSGSGAARSEPTSARCQHIGWIAQVSPRMRHAYLRLAGAAKSCTCPGKNCTRLSRGQHLFANETIFSGGGKITFKSVVKGVPNLTCIVSSNSTNIIYPRVTTRPQDRAVLQLVSGATSCQVAQGAYQKGKKDAVFIVHNTQLKVAAVVDPVFGIKTTTKGSLIQVKKGTISVAASAGQGAAQVDQDQQVVVSRDAASIGPLRLDPTLKPGLCALTEEPRLTDVRTASGAHASGNPVGVAPDPSGNIWFTDDATPAIGVLNPRSGKIAYPQNDGLRPDSVPVFIVADNAGKIWFTDAGPTPALGMIDPKARRIVEYDLPPGSHPWNPAYDPVHKLVWFTDHREPAGTTGAIGAFNPRTKRFAEYSKGLTPGSHPQGIGVDRRGNVWFTDDNDPSPAIGRLDGRTHEIHEYSSGLVPGSLPRGMMIGGDGNVWFADERTLNNRDPTAAGDGLIGTIRPTDPQHRIVEYAVEANGGNTDSVPEGLAWYRGHVWFTDDGATKAIGRLDPTTGAITESSKGLAPNSQPIAIVVAKDVLWFTDRLKSSPKIGRLMARPSC